MLVSQARLSEDPGVAALCSYLAAALGSDPAFRALLSLPHHGLGEAQPPASMCCQRSAGCPANSDPAAVGIASWGKVGHGWRRPMSATRQRYQYQEFLS